MPVIDVSPAELEHDPYPFLAQLRAQAPVAFVPSLGVWLLTRFEDVKRAHNDVERFRTYGPPHCRPASASITSSMSTGIITGATGADWMLHWRRARSAST